MNIVVMWIVVFLTNGAPIPGFMAFPEGTVCTDAMAIDSVRKMWGGVEGGLTLLQDEILWSCMPVQSPGPGPSGHPPIPLVPKEDA